MLSWFAKSRLFIDIDTIYVLSSVSFCDVLAEKYPDYDSVDRTIRTSIHVTCYIHTTNRRHM